MLMIDAHHHLWDMSKATYPWLEAKGTKRFFGMPDPIRNNYLPADYFEDHKGYVDQSVHVQVGCIPEHNLKETELVESFIRQGAPILAIVAAVDVTKSDLEQQLEKQLTFPNVKGVRHMIGKSPEENHQLPKFVGENWLRGWKLIAEHNLSFDLQLTSEQYEKVYETLKLVPELKVAICHFGSPWDQTEQGFKNWQFWMQQFAQLPNCFIKLSGFSMFTHSFSETNFIKYSKTAINIFGVKRCMFGSNFPVDKLHTTYQDLISAWQKLLNEYNVEQQSWLNHKSAERFYLNA